MNYSQTLKLATNFKFISVYFGALLEPFLGSERKNVEFKAITRKRVIEENDENTRIKFFFYESDITTLENFHYQTILYLISFVFRIIEKMITKWLIRTKRNIYKVVFYFILIHDRIHFVLFNIYISGGVFLSLRTILHMQTIPGTHPFQLDKIISVISLIFYWKDICEMYPTSIMHIQVPNTNQNENLKTEEQQELVEKDQR